MCTPSAPKASKDDSKAKELRVLLGRKQLDDLGLSGTNTGSTGVTDSQFKPGKDKSPFSALAFAVRARSNSVNGGLNV